MSRRATWKKVTDGAGRALCKMMADASDSALQRFIRSTRAVPRTSTNCWWLSYHLAPILLDLAKNELLGRRNRRARLKKQMAAARRALPVPADPYAVIVTRKKERRLSAPLKVPR